MMTSEPSLQEQSEILKQLGNKLGLTLAFDANNKCCLILDQHMFINIENKNNGWQFSGLVRSSIAWKEKQFWKNLLSLNFSLAKKNSGTLAYESTEDVLLYISCIPSSELSKDKAYFFLENYTEKLEAIIDQFHNI